jgi:hypothetical protein
MLSTIAAPPGIGASTVPAAQKSSTAAFQNSLIGIVVLPRSVFLSLTSKTGQARQNRGCG